MKLDPKKTAIVTLDLQNGILSMGEAYKACLPQAAKVVSFARQMHYKIIHVGLGFSPDHPEIPNSHVGFARIKENNLFVKGTPSAEFDPSIFKSEDLVIYKHRISAFSENQLDLVLRSQGIENLVLFGIATSGIVLSTVTRGFDLDYNITVIEDACADTDPEVHRVLTEKIYAKRGQVLKADAFISVNR